MRRSWIAGWLALLCLPATAACAFTVGTPTRVGTVTNSALEEISGLVASRSIANTLWVHNDSGDDAQFFAISPQGNLLGTFPLADPSARDWEDIAMGPKAGGGNYLYLGDIGDNRSERSFIAVHRVIEPLSTSGAIISSY